VAALSVITPSKIVGVQLIMPHAIKTGQEITYDAIVFVNVTMRASWVVMPCSLVERLPIFRRNVEISNCSFLQAGSSRLFQKAVSV